MAAGVYSIWQDHRLVYVGMSGRGRSKDQLEAVSLAGTKRVGLHTRLASHASGRRSGDQFCVYVSDRLVLPNLSSRQIKTVAAGSASLDVLTRTFICEHLGFRFCITDDGQSALSLEAECRAGALGGAPLFNPI